MTCPASTVINAVTFASYGTPTGSCGSFIASSCNAATSATVVSNQCMGQQSCSVSAGNGNFGDPCTSIGKQLDIQVGCTALPSMTPTTPSPSLVSSKLPSAVPSSVIPSGAPSTPSPSLLPSMLPTAVPSSVAPSGAPSAEPSTIIPSMLPTAVPSSVIPSGMPSTQPSSIIPSMLPTSPSIIPSKIPSSQPSSEFPSMMPTYQPTSITPTLAPSGNPSTVVPSLTPTFAPSVNQYMLLYFPFTPDTITGSSVTNRAIGFSGILGVLYNWPSVVNDQLVLSSGQSQYMTIGPFGTGSSGYTFAFWFRSSSNNGQWARVFDFGNGQESDNILISTKGTIDGITFQVYQGNYLMNGGQYTLPGPYNDNVWRHVSWALSPYGNGYCTWFIYINGMIVQQLQSMRYPNSLVRSYNYIGKSNWDRDPYFSGAISDFRLYYRVVSAAEVSTVYAATPTSFPTTQPTFTASPSTRIPTSAPSPDLPTTSPTSTYTVLPSVSLTTSPSSGPTIIPYTAFFALKSLSFSGDNFYLYNSLPQDLDSTFTISIWIKVNSYPASMVSLGRSPSSNDVGVFVLEINKNGVLHFWDYSKSTGQGFSVLGGNVIYDAGMIYYNLAACL